MIFECTKDFSKEYKYTLGQDMKRDALQLVRNIYRANKSANKKEHLEAFLDDFVIIHPDKEYLKRLYPYSLVIYLLPYNSPYTPKNSIYNTIQKGFVF
jgi:hypothetical protein